MLSAPRSRVKGQGVSSSGFGPESQASGFKNEKEEKE
jgi:hypothetical protein